LVIINYNNRKKSSNVLTLMNNDQYEYLLFLLLKIWSKSVEEMEDIIILKLYIISKKKK